MESTAERLDRLEKEVDELLEVGSPLWMEEFKRQVLRQVQEMFIDYGQKDIREKIGCMDDLLYCSKRKFCTNLITSKIESASLAYLRNDGNRTLGILDELQRQTYEVAGDCEAGECRNYALSIIKEVRAVFEVAIKVEGRISSIPIDYSKKESFDPQEVSEVLAPLAHPARVSILLKLEKGRMSFSEISKDLGLRTGHLQFHLRSLEKGGFIRRERKGGKYGLSLQGINAISGVRSLMRGISNSESMN